MPIGGLPVLEPDLIDRYAEGLRGNKYAKAQYLSFIRAYGKHVRGAPDKKSVERRLDEMHQAGYAPATIELHFRQIRAFFHANQLDWPFRRGEGPQVKERDTIKLALADDLIARMVQVARSGRISPVDVAHLALATVYAPRRVEIGAITQPHIDLDAKRLLIETRKHGPEREHEIPDDILPVLAQAHPYLILPRSEKVMTESFYRIERAAGLEHTPELGWHAIRRMLVQHLLGDARISKSDVQSFLRWKVPKGDMAERYAHGNTVVSASGRVVSTDAGERDVDRRIFAVHPFLALWEGGPDHAA
jgi:integrase